MIVIKGEGKHLKKRRRKSASEPMSPEMVLKVKELLAADTLFQHQIAAVLNINQGRVSEVKNGCWG